MSVTFDFLRLLYAAVPAVSAAAHDNRGLVTIWSATTKETDFFRVSDLNGASDRAQYLDTQGHDVYVGVGLRTWGTRKRGKATDVCEIPGFWLDIDLKSSDGATAHKAEDLPATPEDLNDIINATGELPTLIVNSGHGLHVWWLFDTPLSVTEGNRSAVAQASKAFQRKAIDYANSRGWHLDDTSDLARILRLPGTRNHKGVMRGVVATPVELLVSDGPRIPCPDFATAQVTVPLPTPDLATAAPPDLGPSEVGKGGHLPPYDKARTVPFRDRLEAYVAKNSKGDPDDKERAALITNVLEGKSFAKVGDRDVKLHKVASIFAYIEPDENPSVLAGYLAPCLAEWESDDTGIYSQSDRLAWATEKIALSQNSARLARAERRAVEQRVREALCEHARGQADPTLPPTIADASPGNEGSAPAVGLYTMEELARYAKQQKCAPAGFHNRWIIQVGGNYYIYSNGAYRDSVKQEALAVHIRQDLAPAPLEFTTVNKDGSERPKKPSEMIRDYGTGIRRVVLDLTLQASYVDVPADTLFEAVTPLRRLPPQFHPEIDQWLNLLGGAQSSRLLDWVATVTDLRRQTGGLYLSGATGTGKTMLAHGLARLWTVGGPTDLGEAISSFNESLTHCPLVCADEFIPQEYKGQHNSAALRDLIGRTSRNLKRKHMATSELRGALRIMFCANHDSLLSFSSEELSGNGLEAVAGRIIHIETTPDVADYLLSLGGPEYLDRWITDDLIAQHALWLRDNRQVKRVSRFLVEGQTTSMHRHLATQGATASLICEWLTRFMNNPGRARKEGQAKNVRLGNGSLLVNAYAITGAWGAYMHESIKMPSIKLVGQALSNLSKAQKRRNGNRYWEIDTELVIEWADRYQLGEPEQLRELINATIKEDDVGPALSVVT